LISILDLAIDDLTTRSGTCQSIPPPPNMYKCLDGAIIAMARVSFI